MPGRPDSPERLTPLLARRTGCLFSSAHNSSALIAYVNVIALDSAVAPIPFRASFGRKGDSFLGLLTVLRFAQFSAAIKTRGPAPCSYPLPGLRGGQSLQLSGAGKSHLSQTSGRLVALRQQHPHQASVRAPCVLASQPRRSFSAAAAPPLACRRSQTARCLACAAATLLQGRFSFDASKARQHNGEAEPGA